MSDALTRYFRSLRDAVTMLNCIRGISAYYRDPFWKRDRSGEEVRKKAKEKEEKRTE